MGPDVEGTQKHHKAMEEGVTILTEAAFMKMLNVSPLT